MNKETSGARTAGLREGPGLNQGWSDIFVEHCVIWVS